MMAAFIVAVRGTPLHAVLLGVSAAFSHSIVVWVMAVLALTWGDEMIGERLEPWFIAGSGAIVMGVGLFMLWRAWARIRHRHRNDDAHVRAHARDIETRFAGGRASAPQTVGFGLVGGLIPCPAAITVLLLCLGIGQFWLGVGMVASFSIGLAVTLVAVGMAAVVGLRYASKRFSGADRLFASAPYVSGVLILLVGTYMTYSGWSHLAPAAGA